MDTVSQFCPSCKSSKYNNPQLRLMVNICGHSLCENCVEVLFVRGSGLCFQCHTPIRKANFRYQLFEDPEVQKEVDIRKKIISEFNKREEDFPSTEEYDLYLEKVEDIIYKLAHDIDVEETRKYIEIYKKENKESIKRNRARQSSCLEFYERELEHEQTSRERRLKEEAEEVLEDRRKRIQQKTRVLQGFFGANGDEPTVGENGHTPSERDLAQPLGDHRKTASATSLSRSKQSTTSSQFVVPPSHRFVPPSGSSLFQKPGTVTPSSFVVPPSKWGSSLPVPPTFSAFSAVTPASGFGPFAPPSGMSGAGLSNWATSADFHNVHIPLPRRRRPANEEDEVVFDNKKSKNSAASEKASLVGETKTTISELLRPYRSELCGPEPPFTDSDKGRWSEIDSFYRNSVIGKLDSKCLIPNLPSLEEDSVEVSTLNRFGSPDTSSEPINRKGMSAMLPLGSCGIAPDVFLRRCLEDSRCGLFM